MKNFLIIFLLFIILSSAKAQNINITLNSDLNLNCKFEKVILKNLDHNFESFTKDQIKRKDINKLIIESKTPDVLNVKNLSEFFNKIDLEVKISNKDIFLIQAFDKERNYYKIKDKHGNDIVVVQIAGLVARRIVCETNKNQELIQGDRIGMIRFGSRADVYYENYEPLVKIGQTAISGETLLAKK